VHDIFCSNTNCRQINFSKTISKQNFCDFGHKLNLFTSCLKCPIFDQEESIHYGGIYQTITTSGALIITKSHPFLDGFIVVIIAHTDHEQCRRRDAMSLPFSNLFSKSLSTVNNTVTIKVEKGDGSNASTQTKYLAWGLPLGIAAVIIILVFGVLKFWHRFIR